MKAFGGAPIAELAGGEEEETFGAGPCQVRDALRLGACTDIALYAWGS